jgi:D-alanyl-lipoteichoic acid acyltransferase DltB (MBOAT superfamily)
MSYTIDVYRHELEPERNPVTYFAFVSFFPHMVAGPIQRARHLLGQLNRPRTLDLERTREGIWLLVYGYFLKEMVANPAATFADAAFWAGQPSGWTTLLGTLAFAIQIYCDFCGYSLIARGSGRLLGIEFIWNFNQPYFATSPRDFWRRWHISLSSWLRDYLYVPLGGNRKGRARTYFNLMLTMGLGGLWHGAAWNFVLWGLLHGAALAGERAYEDVLGPRRPRLPAAVGWIGTMAVVLVGWFLFRCHSWEMIRGMTASLAHLNWTADHSRELASLAIIAAPVVAIELWQYAKQDLLTPLTLRPLAFAALGGVLLLFTAVMFERLHYAFIYFQF